MSHFNFENNKYRLSWTFSFRKYMHRITGLNRVFLPLKIIKATHKKSKETPIIHCLLWVTTNLAYKIHNVYYPD